MTNQSIKRPRPAESGDDEEYQVDMDTNGSSQMRSIQRVKIQPMTTDWDEEVKPVVNMVGKMFWHEA